MSHDMLQIPIDRFRAVDLRFPFDLGRKFDLACSLEVAEHLPQTSAQVYVETLVQAAPIVLFSAAIPGQGGMSHVNEQWQSTWAELFAQHGYEPYDYIRPKIYDNPSVEWWYKQNIVLFCASGFAPSRCGSAATAYELDRVHPQVLRISRRVRIPEKRRSSQSSGAWA